MAMLNPPSQPSAGKSPSAVRYLDTTCAYDRWAEVYDTDGNFLQALDTIEMKNLLPETLSLISTVTKTQPCKLVDLGCGTGRNTLQLLHVVGSRVVGLDASPKMLEIAKTRINAALTTLEEGKRALSVELDVFDLLQTSGVPPAASGADAVISTLVLEHVPMETFFAAADGLLKAGGLLLVTNMHSEMGGISQAGFVDPMTGEKIRPKSYAHRVEDVTAQAEKHGFEIVGDVLERRVNEGMSQALGHRARKWIGVMVWFGICFRKRGNQQ